MDKKQITIQFICTGKAWGMFGFDPGEEDEPDAADIIGVGNPAGIGEQVEDILRKLEANDDQER